MERSLSFKNWEIPKVEKTEPINREDDQVLDTKKSTRKTLNGRNFERIQITRPTITSPEPFVFFSPRPVTELDAAATKLQKVYQELPDKKEPSRLCGFG